MSRSQPKYPLNVTAQLVGLSPRTLRGYEEARLIRPARVGGNRQRMYSEQDVIWLKCIRDMIHEEGLTVTAIRRLLDLIPCWEIRHCPGDVALGCAPHLNIPEMASRRPDTAQIKTPGDENGPENGTEAVEAHQAPVQVALIYGVEEFGTVLHCSRCVSMERTARRVAEKYEGQVSVTTHSIRSREAEDLGVTVAPAVAVNGEIVSEGKGISEQRLTGIIDRWLDRVTVGPLPD